MANDGFYMSIHNGAALNGTFGRNIRYVHEFQNTYAALTGLSAELYLFYKAK
jgi:hypothetical protein